MIHTLTHVRLAWNPAAAIFAMRLTQTVSFRPLPHTLLTSPLLQNASLMFHLTTPERDAHQRVHIYFNSARPFSHVKIQGRPRLGRWKCIAYRALLARDHQTPGKIAFQSWQVLPSFSECKRLWRKGWWFDRRYPCDQVSNLKILNLF